MKNKETLEEVAENYINSFQFGIAHPRKVCKKAFINGAKWQQEQESTWFDEYQKLENYIINRIGDNFLKATPEKYETPSEATIALLEDNWKK